MKDYKGRDELPADFDTFWDQALAKMTELPEYKLEERDFSIPNVICYELTFKGTRDGLVYARVVPYFEQEILPKLQNGENILLVAHGNSIRALIKHLDQVPETEMANVEMPFGQLLVYTFEPGQSLPIRKEVLSVEIEAVNA